MARFVFLLAVLWSVFADDSRLILLDDLELKSYIPSSSWDLVVQNPFKGAIEIAESPVDKFQILINVTNGLSSNQKINYLLRNTDDAVYVELYSRVAELTVKSTGEEEKIYLQLLFVTVSALVLVVFVVSIIFSCWWLKSQKWEDETQLTDAVYYITLPPEDASLKCSKNANQDSYLRPGSLEDPELIELLPTHLDSELKQQSNDQRTSSQLCASPPKVGLSIDPTSDLGIHGATSACPTGYPIPRYVIAGGVSTNVTYGQSPLTESNMLGRTPILISANAADLLSSPPDGTSSPPVAYVRLAPQSGTAMVSDAAAKFTSNMLSGGDHNSLRVHTLPGRRHVAKEFLDESVMATMTRSRGKAYAAHTSSALTGNRSAVSQPIPEATALTGQATQPALLSLHTPLVFVPGVSGENVSSLDSAMAMMSGARAVIPSLTTMGHPTYQIDTSAVHDGQLYVSRDPAVSLVELFTHSGVPLSIPTGSDVAATEAAIVTDHLSVCAVQDSLGQGEREEGSNETSGIVTDSDGSTNLVGSECSALLTQPGFARGMGTLVATTPPIASLVASGVTISNRPQPTVVPLSVLTGVSSSSASATYVPSDIIAEMASCPQHSYLFRQSSSTEETSVKNSGRMESSTTRQSSIPRSDKNAKSLVKTVKHGLSVPATSAGSAHTSSTTGSSASSLQTVVAADEYALGSGAGVPDVPSLFKSDFPPSSGQSRSKSQGTQGAIKTTAADSSNGSFTLSRNRHGPSPPKRSVSLTGKQTPKVSRASTNVSTSSSTATAGVTSTTANSGSDSSSVSIETGQNSFTTNGNRTGSLEKLGSFENGQETKGDSMLTAIETDVYQGEVRASTLGRTPSSVTKEIAVELTPGSSATLPSSGSNPRSALKGADRTGPKVSKHLRFTTLTVITFMLLLAMVLGESRVNPDAPRLVKGDRPNSRPGSSKATDPGISKTPDQSPPLIRWNVIRSFGSAGSDSSRTQSTNSGHYRSVEPWIRLTIWFPRHMLPEKSTSRPRKKSSGKSSTNSRKSPEKRGPESIQLWLNKTSHTEVHLASPIERSMVHIYDAVNAHQNLGTRVCRQRYACEHSCDPGARHDCICQRGYRPAGPQDRVQLMSQGTRDLDTVQGRVCLDVDECARPEVRLECARLGGVCTNRPGDYACLCRSGRPCLECNTTCPRGFWASGDCQRNQSIECKPCSGPCPTGMYEVQPCGPNTDRICQACRPLCISEEFEFTPCKASSNRVCKQKSLIPELNVPYKKNVWFENMQMVRDSLLILTPDDLNRLPANKSLLLDRSSGYQVRLDLDSLNLLPVLGPVDHSSGNDNALFLAAARVLDRTVAEPEAYRWSSATGQYHTIHAYSSKANNTLSKLCPYPVPPLYRLGILAHRNVTTATVPDTSLPGHRPVLASCRTYRRHGYFPPVDTQSDHSDSTASDVHSPMDAYSRQYANSMESGRYVQDATSTTALAPVVACLEPSRLPAIFGSHWNVELASPRAVYYEEKQICGQLKLDCQHCLAACAEELKSSSLTCKPTSNPADNGRSPRLEICFDCCARDNCSDVCDKYPAHRCHMQMCHYGLRLDFPLTPEWPKQGEFLCHVHPAPSRPVYRLHWSLLYQGRPLTPDRFPASLVLSTPNADGERRSSVDAQSSNERYHLGQGGQLNQIYRGLLNVRYTSGLEHLPDMIGGTDTMQSAYFWSKQTIPLVSGSATNTAFDPIASATSAAATGAIYANTMHSSSSHELSSVQVWPSQPLGVSTAAWARLSGAPCAAADPLLEQLNVYTPALPPYIAMGEAKVEYVGNYLYTVSHTKTKPKLTFSLPRSASLLGAVFSPASVERGQYLRASLALAWVSGATGMDPGSRRDSQFTGTKSAETPESFETNSFGSSPESGPSRMQRYWVIDLTGQVDQFPGLFRLKVYPDNGDIDSANPAHASSRFLQREFSDATVEVEDEPGIADVDSNDPLMANEPEGEPLIEYDVGVFEERKFQLRILIPGPETEPDYEKAFRLIILDAKNRLDIRVKRAIQPPNEMALRRSYERLIDDDMRPALVDLLPSLAARQQAMWLQASHAAQENNVNSHRVQSDSKTDGTENPDDIVHHLPQFGPPPSLVYAVVFALLCMLLFLLIGLVMQADPTLSWIKLSRCDESTINTPGNSADGDRVALVPNPARLCHNNRLSRWCRVLLLIGYLCLKSAYTFGVTLTALVIIIRYVTREPADRLANLPEWNGVGDQPGEFMGTSLTRQKLLQDAMDVHLRAELIRQQTEARRIRDACDRGIEAMFDQMESRLDAASKLAASRRSRVLLSQAVAELARATALSSTLQLAEGLIAFNQTAEWALHRLKSDLGDTERALGNSDWLTGARIIYSEVVRLRGLTPDPADPTRSFLNWAKLTSGQTPHGVDELDSVFGSSMQHRAMLLPLLQPDQFRIPTPPLLTRSDSGGSGSSTGLVADADEPEYGPKYVPFVPTSVDAEVNEAFWSTYDADSNPPSGIGMDDMLDTSSESDKTGASSGTSPGTAGMNSEPAVVGSMASTGFMLSNLQLGWVHVLGATLLLDALWLIHRVLHTVDTAERILYGDIIFIDLTAEGIRKRLSQKNRLRSGCKHAFETAMQPGTVRKLCGGVLALLIVSQAAAHLDRLLSQDTLDYIGYYDNLILPVHLHARLVNVHVSRSAQRLNQYDMAGLESEVSRRLREAQFLLHQWTAWLKDIEQEQCRLLLAYKASAQQVRTKMAAKINRNPGLSKLQLPIHVIHSQSQTGSSYGYSSGSPGWSELRAEVDDSRQSASPEALVPRHCRLTQPEQELELAESRQLDPPHCPLNAIVPVLFKGYNASDYFTEVVKQSESWLSAARDYLGRTLYCIFVYVSALVLWNTIGSVIWFYLDRLNVLPKKVLFESDPSSWNLPESVQQL